jgi:4-amino-4-deoxy-L-arabinose transferase-like glycosyltransferase
VRPLAAAIAVVTLIRLAVAATAPMTPDETYYWVWSHALAFGYLDHPPMVAFWIKAGTTLAGQTALGVRLLGPLSAALASWMLFDAARLLFPGTRTGLIAVLLLNASLLLGVGTVIMTPDSPLLFFWTATVWAISHIAARPELAPPRVMTGSSPRVMTGLGPVTHDLPARDYRKTRGSAMKRYFPRVAQDPAGLWWLLAGAFGGLALDSKYTALFLWIGIGAWLLWVPAMRPWLRRWQPWAACAIGLALFAPVLAWNATHHWAGLLKQGGRVDDWRPSRAVGFLLELVGGQIGLATPLVFAQCMLGLATAARHTWRSRDPAWSLLAALSLPPILVFVQHTFGDRVQGNWPAIIYPALVIAAGAVSAAPRWWISASALGFVITFLAYAQAVSGVLPIPPRLDPIALRLAGWNTFAQQVTSFWTRTGAAFVAVEGYGPASELAWWLPPQIPVVAPEERWALTTLPAAHLPGMTGLLVRDARRRDAPDPALWTDVRSLGFAQRSKAPGEAFTVYQATAIGSAAEPELPHR